MASYHGKRVLKQNRLMPLAVAALLMLLVASVGSTLAWLTHQTEPITNAFSVATLSVKIDEEFDQVTKKNVRVQNTGSMDAYIRVALIPTWTSDADGKNPVAVPVEDGDVYFDLVNMDKWVVGSDGYIYYTDPVAPGAFTDVLVETATVLTANGYHMNLQVMADAIQAAPDDAVIGAWEAVTGVNADTTLQISEP